MVEESSPPAPPAEESIEVETDAAFEPESESGEPTPEPGSEPAFVCGSEERLRSACGGMPFYRELEGRRYCVLHYPAKDKSADFKTALERKLNQKDFDFRGVWFPEEVDFGGFHFGAPVVFTSAMFNMRADFASANFQTDVDFSSVKFRADAIFVLTKFGADAHFAFSTFSSEAHFGNSEFKGEARFISTTFRANAYFNSAKFRSDAYFPYATFKETARFQFAGFAADAHFNSSRFTGAVDFNQTTFEKHAYFERAVFLDAVRFFRDLHVSTTLALDFQHTRIEKPERVSFHTVALCPHCFVNVDSREFVFTDVRWEWSSLSIEEEVECLFAKNVSSPYSLLAISCRQLAENAESNNRYEEASNFRYWAMDLGRRTKWKGFSFWKTDWLHMFYWAVSGYGEKILRALGVLAAVWIVFVLLYTRVGFAQQPPRASNESASSVTAASMTTEDRAGQPLEFSRALTYSLAVMSLQRPEPRPLTNWAHTLVTLETILGPLQAALLALAIRRKFMR